MCRGPAIQRPVSARTALQGPVIPSRAAATPSCGVRSWTGLSRTWTNGSAEFLSLIHGGDSVSLLFPRGLAQGAPAYSSNTLKLRGRAGGLGEVSNELDLPGWEEDTCPCFTPYLRALLCLKSISTAKGGIQEHCPALLATKLVLRTNGQTLLKGLNLA